MRSSRSVTEPLPPNSRGLAVVRTQIKPDNRLLTPAEVAAMLRVDPKTVTRWARRPLAGGAAAAGQRSADRPSAHPGPARIIVVIGVDCCCGSNTDPPRS